MPGLYERLFGPKKDALTCPFCLREANLLRDERKCPLCGKDIPPLYRRDFKRVQPLFAPIIGWTNSGKTMALYAMTQTFEALPRIWKNPTSVFSSVVDSQETLDWLREIRDSMKATGKLPDSTQKVKQTDGQKGDVQPSYVLQVHNLLRWHPPGMLGRTLVFRDFPGEVFRDLKIDDEYVPMLTIPSTVILMYCLSDLEDRTTEAHKLQIHELLISYITTLMNPPYNIDVRRKKPRMIVVFSQADKLVAKNVLPPHLKDYLLGDPIARDLQAERPDPWDDLRMAKYVEEMKRASDQIRDWVTDRHASAQSLVGQAGNNAIDLRFCLVSATGGEVNKGEDGDVLRGHLNPYRILDPLFHALEYDVVGPAR